MIAADNTTQSPMGYGYFAASKTVLLAAGEDVTEIDLKLARGGVISVIKAGPKFEKLAENRLPDTVTASVVVSNGRIYIRGWETLYAISEGGK